MTLPDQTSEFDLGAQNLIDDVLEDVSGGARDFDPTDVLLRVDAGTLNDPPAPPAA